MNAVSLFAGIGGFDLALERNGHTVTDQVEIDPHARKTLTRHFPDSQLHEDIHDFAGPDTDIVVGGFPCQDYSVAGRRGGLVGDRGALWWQMHRVIDESRPTWVIGENVPGLVSSNDGRDFRTIIDSLVDLGYGVVWRVLDAQYFGVAQRRRRVFIVGHSGGQPRPEVFALGQGSIGDPPPSREPRQDVAPTISARTRGGGGLGTDFDLDGGLIGSFAWQAGGNNSGAFNGHDEATPTPPTSQTLAVAFAQNQRDEVRTMKVAGALAAEPGMKQQTYLFEASRRDGIRIHDDTPPTLQSFMGTGGNNMPMVTDPRVRRLTPLECERLQGFPDGWTEGNSDTQRYRQLGNAVAVPVVDWIVQNLNASDQRSAA